MIRIEHLQMVSMERNDIVIDKIKRINEIARELFRTCYIQCSIR